MSYADMERDAATPSTEQEQEQGLLSDWKECEHIDETRKAEPTTTRKTWPVAAIAIAILLLAASLAVIMLLALRNPRDTSDPGQHLTGIQTNDYVLDPAWDLQAPPQRREFTWVVKDYIHNPDGIYRQMLLVNQQFPGPLIECNEGDTIVVHVDNQASNATSVHWHGIYQRGTPWMDGTVGVSQCPIGPGQQFTYEFTVSNQSGTYWWHSHQGLQSADGMHGPLVIHARDEKSLQRVPYDTDRVVLVSDHYHDLSGALLWQYLKPDMENTEPVPLGGLINGRSIRDCSQFLDRRCDNTTRNVDFARLDLAPDKTHRLRVINVGSFAEFRFQIDEHELQVTEVDGTDVEPIPYHRIDISPAQRYSVIVNASSTASDTFWLRARMVTTCFTDAPDELDPDVLAVVRYNPEQHALPTSRDWEDRLAQECKDLNTTELNPVQEVKVPEPDAFFYLRSNFEIGRYRLSRGFFNSTSYQADVRSPSLHRAVDGFTSGNTTFTANEQGAAAFVNDAAFDTSREFVIQTNGIQVVDILVSNFDDGNHPLHLHGYKYFVLATGHGHPPLTHVAAEVNRANLGPLYDSLDLSNPLRRDTASVEAYGWTLIRIVADNPGTWAFHCHIAWHSEAGLMMQFLTRADELATMSIPTANLDLCAAPNLEAGMGPEVESYREQAE